MKVGIVLIILLAGAFTGAISAYAYEDIEKITLAAKSKNGVMILMRNNYASDIYSVTFTLEGYLTNTKIPRNWFVNAESEERNTVTLFTTSDPIKRGERVLFFLGADEGGESLRWSAFDERGSTLFSGDARIKVPISNSADHDLYTLGTNRIFYSGNDNVIISGKLVPKEDIIVTIYSPSGTKIKITGETDEEGNFTILHVLHDAERGIYKVKVKQNDISEETTFTVN